MHRRTAEQAKSKLCDVLTKGVTEAVRKSDFIFANSHLLRLLMLCEDLEADECYAGCMAVIRDASATDLMHLLEREEMTSTLISENTKRTILMSVPITMLGSIAHHSDDKASHSYKSHNMLKLIDREIASRRVRVKGDLRQMSNLELCDVIGEASKATDNTMHDYGNYLFAGNVVYGYSQSRVQ